uniref:Tetratricopeptide repeat protein n=1 Tax=Ascaris lumbricoides TaxID=6252 RepID=A0A0M3IVZ8_ASCLU
MSETYHDPWQDYKAILESLKKKFLKKPNYAQALVEFSNLALRFEDEECEHYAAMCNYQMSKIYEGLGDWSLQYSRLLKAARLFRDAEIKTHDMCSLEWWFFVNILERNSAQVLEVNICLSNEKTFKVKRWTIEKADR